MAHTQRKLTQVPPGLFVDIDECTAEEFPCAEQANCVNNEGDFECVCPGGYEGHGKDYCSGNYINSIVTASPVAVSAISTRGSQVWQKQFINSVKVFEQT